MTFEEFLQLKNFPPKSIREHCRKIVRLGKFNEKNVTTTITDKLQHQTAATANKYLNTYRLYGKYQVEKCRVKEKRLKWLQSFHHCQEIHRQRAIFSFWELDKFLKYQDHYSPYFTLLSRTGARPAEIANLKKADIDYANNLILIQKSKTGEGRTVPIADDLIAKFYQFLRSHSSNWCFPIKNQKENHITPDGVRRAFKIRKIKLNLNPELTPYCLRHTFITRMLSANVPLFVVQQIVGHKNANTTQVYFHNNTDLMRGAMKKDPIIWHCLPAGEKLKMVGEQICNLGLDSDPQFSYTRTSISICLHLK